MTEETTSEKIELILDAISGRRGKDQERIAHSGLDWLVLLLRKNHDYGSSVWTEPFFCPGMDVGSAILVRMSDKAERLRNLIKKEQSGGSAEVEESLEDTFMDLGTYCLLYLSRPETGRNWKTETDSGAEHSPPTNPSTK